MKIIALGHRQRVGKDTAGMFMLTHLRSNGISSSHHMGIFDPIKDVAAHVFGWAGMQRASYYTNNPEDKDKLLPAIGKTPRQIMLELGHSIMQISDRTVPELALQHQSVDYLILNGIRRKIEIDYVRKFNGVCINIERDVPKLESLLTGHPAYALDSELDDYTGWDHTIVNNGTLRDFNRTICSLTESIIK